MKFAKENSGLSLIEIMIVVSIIGLLAALAFPKFRAFKSRSYRAEAYTSLYKIHALQGTYHAENDYFTELADVGYSVSAGSGDPITDCNVLNNLGFSLTDCRKARYRFNTEAGSPTTTAFLAHATAEPLDGTGLNKVYPGCAMFDNITINQGRGTNILLDSIALCN